MTQSEINRYREKLERKQAELAVPLSPRREQLAIDRSADTLDNARCAIELEMTVDQVDRDSIVLRSVRAALGRMDDGTYGTCIRCETAINSRRLAAIPWTPLCIKCQEGVDCSGTSLPITRRDPSSDAA